VFKLNIAPYQRLHDSNLTSYRTPYLQMCELVYMHGFKLNLTSCQRPHDSNLTSYRTIDAQVRAAAQKAAAGGHGRALLLLLDKGADLGLDEAENVWMYDNNDASARVATTMAVEAAAAGHDLVRRCRLEELEPCVETSWEQLF